MIQQEEQLLGAYRTLKKLPSGSPHLVLIEQQQPQSPVDGQDDATATAATPRSFFVESVLSDASNMIDILTVTAASLDPAAASQHRLGGSSSKTLPTLSTIVHNVLNTTGREKVSGAAPVQRAGAAPHCVVSGGECACCTPWDFENNSSNSKVTTTIAFLRSKQLELLPFEHAQRLLRLLMERSAPSFVAETAAAPVPWQAPVFTSNLAAASSVPSNNWNAERTHRFISPEERWARAERWSALRGGRRPRRPEPGGAPSSRGRWGR